MALVVQHLGLDASLALITKHVSQPSYFDDMLKYPPTGDISSQYNMCKPKPNRPQTL